MEILISPIGVKGETKEEKLRFLIAKLDDAICWRQRAMCPEDVVDGFEEVDRIKNKIINQVCEK